MGGSLTTGSGVEFEEAGDDANLELVHRITSMQPAEMVREGASSPNATMEAPMEGPMALVARCVRLVNELALGSNSVGVISGMVAV